MKKLLLLLLVVIMSISLTGCRVPQEIEGTYELSIDLYDDVIAAFDGAEGEIPEALSIRPHLSEFNLILTYQFFDNATYSVSLDRDALEQSIAQLDEALTAVMKPRLIAATAAEFAKYGIPLETEADVEKLLCKSTDDLFVASMGMPMEEYIENTLSEGFVMPLTAKYNVSGNYTAAEGTLFLSDSLETEPPTDRYESYVINEDGSITFTIGVNISEEHCSYPYTLTPAK